MKMKKLKKLFCILLAATALLSVGTFAYAAGEAQPGQSGIQPGEQLVLPENTDWATLTAEWEREVYHVKYVVIADHKYGCPKDSFVPVDNNDYYYNDPVTVHSRLRTRCTYAIVNGQAVYGSWRFYGWDHNDFLIHNDTTITGRWRFSPGNTPITGDTGRIALWLSALTLSGGAIAYVLIALKKKGNRQI